MWESDKESECSPRYQRYLSPGADSLPNFSPKFAYQPRQSSGIARRHPLAPTDPTPSSPRNQQHKQAQQLRHKQEQQRLEQTFRSSLNCRVQLGGEKFGVLRYFGPLHMADGLFCGIELDDELGKHDGRVDGYAYFSAGHNRGIFAPVEKVLLLDDGDAAITSSEPRLAHSLGPERQQMARSTPESKGNSTDSLVPIEFGGEEGVADFELQLVSSAIDESSNADKNELFDQTMELSDSLLAVMQQKQSGELETTMTSSSHWMLSDIEADDPKLYRQHSNPLLLEPGSAFHIKPTALSVSQGRNAEFSSLTVSGIEDFGDFSSHIFVDDENQTYSDDLATPICDENLEFLESHPQYPSGHQNFSSAPSTSFDRPPLVEKNPTMEHRDKNGILDPQVKGHHADFSLNDPLRLNPASIRPSRTFDLSTGDQKGQREEGAPASAILLRSTTAEVAPSSGHSKAKERPISTVSADTGYQGDTEYDTQSGRSCSPPEMDLGRSTSGQTLMVLEPRNFEKFRTPTEIHETACKEVDFCTAETIFRDSQGKVVKIVKFIAAGSAPVSVKVPCVPSPEVPCSEILCGNATTPTVDEPKLVDCTTKQDQTNVKLSPGSQTPSFTLSPEAPATKTEEMANTVEKPKEKTAKVGSTSRLLKLPLARKVSDFSELKKPAKFDATKAGPTEVVKKCKPAPKPSKNAEIMAKLQMSIAQEKVKPKKEIKSRVFAANDGSKDDSAGVHASRSQSRASSTVQLSPMDVVSTNPDSKHSPAESISTNVSSSSIPLTNGTFKKPTSKITEKKSTKIKKDTGAMEPTKISSSVNSPTPKISQVQHSNSKQSLLPATARKLSSKTCEDSQKDSNLKKNLDMQILLAKRLIEHNSNSFDVMCVLMKHANDQVIPELQTALAKVKIDLNAAKEHSDASLTIFFDRQGHLTAENEELSNRISAICEKYDSSALSIKSAYEANEKHLQNSLKIERSKSAKLQSFLEMEKSKLLVDFEQKEALLIQNHLETLEAQSKLMERKISTQKENYEKELSDLKDAFSNEKAQLKDEVEACKINFQTNLQESHMTCEKLRKEAKILEASLMADTEKKIQVIKERFSVYEQEINSLRAVLDMKSVEVHDLRAKNQSLEKELENYSTTKAKIAVLGQKNRELTDALEMKKLAEQHMSQKHLELRRKLDHEQKSAQKLSMTNDELQYRLQQQQQQSLMSQSVYATPSGGFFPSTDGDDGEGVSASKRRPSPSMTSSMLVMPSPKVTPSSKSVTSSPKMTPSMKSSARRATSTSGMSQSLVQVYSNISPRSDAMGRQVPVIVYSSDGVSRTLCSDHGFSGHKRRSASEKLTDGQLSMNSSSTEVTPFVPRVVSKNTTNSGDCPATEKRSSSVPNNRRMSPFRSSSACSIQAGANSPMNCSMIGAPGVETVFEETHQNFEAKKPAENDPPQFAATSGFRNFTDSGVFTGSSDLLTALDRRPSEEQADQLNPHVVSGSPKYHS